MKRVALVLVALGILGLASTQALGAGVVTTRVAVGYGPTCVRPAHHWHYGGCGPAVVYPHVWRPAVVVPVPVYPPVVYPPIYTVPGYYPAPFGAFRYYGPGVSVGIGF